MKGCYYKILGVSVVASQEEIKRAFRMLALRWHPDRNPKEPRAVERFKEALEAYETLIDPTNRWQYDKVRGYEKPRRRDGARPRQRRSRGMVDAAVEEILQEAFGVRREDSEGAGRGTYDLLFELQVTGSSTREGSLEDIEYERMIFCRECVGTAGRRSTEPCRVCRGDGEVLEKRFLRIWIPAGSRSGMRIRVNGEGDALWPGRPAGDLVILLHVLEGI
jgi:molecular chaperone DnaJ